MYLDDPKLDRVDHLLARARYFKASDYVHYRAARVRSALTEGESDPDDLAADLRRYVKGKGDVRFNRCVAAAIAALEAEASARVEYEMHRRFPERFPEGGEARGS